MPTPRVRSPDPRPPASHKSDEVRADTRSRVKNAFVSCLLVVLVLGLLCAPGSFAQPAGIDAARQADAFLQQARGAASPSEAADFLASALQLAPDYSEALYARARLEDADQAGTLPAIADLQKALFAQSWTVTDPASARRDLAEILLRIGRLAEARTILTELAARDASNARTYLLLARLYDRAGEIAALGRILSDAAVKFPGEDDFALLLSRLRESQGNGSEARSVISAQLKVHPDSLPLLLRAAEVSPAGQRRVLAVDAYAARGGKNPLAAVLALEAHAPEPQKYLSQFIDNEGLSREDLVERVARVVRGNARLTSTFQSALSTYSGNRDLDPRGDGYYQERWKLQDGQVVSWIRDTREDGQAELSAAFADGMPASLTIRMPGDTLVTLSYSTYPYIGSVVVPASSAGPAGTYLPVPYTMTYRFLSSATLPVPAGAAPLALRNMPTFPLAQVLRSSSAVEELAPDGTLVRRTELLRGQTVFMEEKTRPDGPFDHRVWYVNGQPVRGERDLDGSGRFDEKETYQAGRLASIAVDTNGDGIVDYRESYFPMLRKSWDFDEDGKDDSQEYIAGTGTVVREFSSRLNGVFDISFTWRNGNLVGATRRGRSLGVTADPARHVVWIGPEPAASVSFDSSGPEGYRSIGGKEYLLFRHEGVTYVEEVP